MLRILGSPKRLCNGVTRRELLLAGGLGLGLGPAALLAPASATAASNGAVKWPRLRPGQECHSALPVWRPQSFGVLRSQTAGARGGARRVEVDSVDLARLRCLRTSAASRPYSRSCDRRALAQPPVEFSRRAVGHDRHARKLDTAGRNPAEPVALAVSGFSRHLSAPAAPKAPSRPERFRTT